MGKSTSSITDTTAGTNPEVFGPSLAHIVKIENSEEKVLGQAWLAAENTLVTCGHVVEAYIEDPSAIVAIFPYSGNCYSIQEIRMHPSFVRQPDSLVKFDIAALSVSLSFPEEEAPALPFAFESPLTTNQQLAAVRYPIHLGRLTASPQPLSQTGKFLGPLRKHDNFHLLHDLALAPGDSGAPIFDGSLVVAIHCGDTATLPGLNLPTTSIRLGLWVDSLKELGLSETAGLISSGRMKRFYHVAAAFLSTLMVTIAISLFMQYSKAHAKWTVVQPSLKPVNLTLNKPLKDYKFNDVAEIKLEPGSDCSLYLFDINSQGTALMLYPLPGFSPLVRAGNDRKITEFGGTELRVGGGDSKLHLVALISDDPLVKKVHWERFDLDGKPIDPHGLPLLIDGPSLKNRIEDFEQLSPEGVLHLILDAPKAAPSEEPAGSEPAGDKSGTSSGQPEVFFQVDVGGEKNHGDGGNDAK